MDANANGTNVTLCAWQNQKSIVSHRSIKSEKVRLIETIISNDMKWHEMNWNGIKWYEMKRNETKWHKMIWREMIWKDVKGYEKILSESNICKGLFTRMIGVPWLMWQRQTHAKISGNFWSVYVPEWPKSSSDHSDMFCSIIIFCRTWKDSILIYE